eukprot:2549169-Rhodomonas_salina.5
MAFAFPQPHTRAPRLSSVDFSFPQAKAHQHCPCLICLPHSPVGFSPFSPRSFAAFFFLSPCAFAGKAVVHGHAAVAQRRRRARKHHVHGPVCRRTVPEPRQGTSRRPQYATFCYAVTWLLCRVRYWQSVGCYAAATACPVLTGAMAYQDGTCCLEPSEAAGFLWVSLKLYLPSRGQVENAKKGPPILSPFTKYKRPLYGATRLLRHARY